MLLHATIIIIIIHIIIIWIILQDGLRLCILNSFIFPLFCRLTHADDSRGSKEFSGVYVCLSVCPRDKTKTA